MKSTMQNAPLLVKDILEHGRQVYGSKKVFTILPEGHSEFTFSALADRATQLAYALREIGVDIGDRVATFMWNNHQHLEIYFAVPSLGAVLHTLNIRLDASQLSYIIQEADDKLIFVDATLLPLFNQIETSVLHNRTIIVVGSSEQASNDEFLDYESLIRDHPTRYEWPIFDERNAAGMCFTSGTTGMPKGVVYSHRSTWLHSLGSTTANSIGLCEKDRALLVVPMFHVNAWGAAYSSFMSGTELILPQMFLQGEPLLKVIETLKPTIALGVPTIWNDLLRAAREAKNPNMSSLRAIVAGGSAVPESMVASFKDNFDIDVVQGYGMTETSPLVAISNPPSEIPPADTRARRVKTGRIVAGVSARICDQNGQELNKDGISIGELELRGPWITGSYFNDLDEEQFHDGWLKTGDIASIDQYGYLNISDRSKDVIKSGGEWISSVQLEGVIMGHPNIFEAAVIAIPHDKWQERPLCCVVAQGTTTVSPLDIQEWLRDKVPKWWIPENWSFLESIPKTSVGKFDKKILRQMYQDQKLPLTTLE
jgi:fatty-acyl-CoA synthase